jgi:Domain of Unknown Function (DUF326)
MRGWARTAVIRPAAAAPVTALGWAGKWDSRVLRPLLEACTAICRSCGEECERHAPMHAHCRVCAEACRRCEQACGEVLKVMR